LLGQKLRGVPVNVDMDAVENYSKEFFVMITNTVYFVHKFNL